MLAHEQARRNPERTLDRLIVLVRRTQDGLRTAEFAPFETLLHRVELDEIVLRIREMEG